MMHKLQTNKLMIRSQEQQSVMFCLCLICVFWGLRNAAFVSNSNSNSHLMQVIFTLTGIFLRWDVCSSHASCTELHLKVLKPHSHYCADYFLERYNGISVTLILLNAVKIVSQLISPWHDKRWRLRKNVKCNLQGTRKSFRLLSWIFRVESICTPHLSIDTWLCLFLGWQTERHTSVWYNEVQLEPTITPITVVELSVGPCPF